MHCQHDPPSYRTSHPQHSNAPSPKTTISPSDPPNKPLKSNQRTGIHTLPPVLLSKNNPSPSQESTLPKTFPPNPRFVEYQNANPIPPLSAPETRNENSASQYTWGFCFLDHIAPSKCDGECGVRTTVSECRIAEPKVSKFWVAEVKGWEMVKEVSGWSWHCAR
jgi:hypothetical protein